MTVLIALIAINALVWVALVCAARWQGGLGQMRASDSDAAVGMSLVAVDGHR